MVGVIVAFPKQENAAYIHDLLTRGGIAVTGVCTTGAQAMNLADEADEGIVVCGYKFKDMMYTELREYLPERFEMLLIASPDKWSDDLVSGVVGLSMPVKAYDLVNTVHMLLETITRRRKERRQKLQHRDPGQQAVIDEAKELLMNRNNMTEEEAHRYLQKTSMDSGTNMTETAEMILRIMQE